MIAIPNALRDPVGFWTWLRDHHDRKSSEGLTDDPRAHEDLAWEAQKTLTWLEQAASKSHPTTSKEFGE